MTEQDDNKHTLNADRRRPECVHPSVESADLVNIANAYKARLQNKDRLVRESCIWHPRECGEF